MVHDASRRLHVGLKAGIEQRIMMAGPGLAVATHLNSTRVTACRLWQQRDFICLGVPPACTFAVSPPLSLSYRTAPSHGSGHIPQLSTVKAEQCLRVHPKHGGCVASIRAAADHVCTGWQSSTDHQRLSMALPRSRYILSPSSPMVISRQPPSPVSARPQPFRLH